MARLPNFEPTDWALTDHGDSRQRMWSSQLCELTPHYEAFWQHHIVPLTFRPHQPDNYFLRPSQKKHLIDLADASYAVFFHLAGCLEWREEIPLGNTQGKRRTSECLYCFFCHLGSLVDAALAFCDAVNRTLIKYKENPIFDFHQDREGRSKGLSSFRAAGHLAPGFNAFAKRERQYRNFLVHTRPVLAQSDFLPTASCIEELSGLTAISLVARNNESLRSKQEPLQATLEGFVEEAGQVLDGLWNLSNRGLSSIENPKYRQEQLTLNPQDAGLTVAKILAARG